MNAGEILWQQTIPRHRHEDSRLPELEDEKHRGKSGERSGTDERLRPRFTGEGGRHRRRIPEINRVFLNAGEHDRHEHVKQRANDQAGDHADRQIALRIFRFLRRGGDGIETDEGKENNRGAAHDAAKSARREGCQFAG